MGDIFRVILVVCEIRIVIAVCRYPRMSFSSNLNHYGMVHVASVSDVLLDASFTPPCQRMGAMVAFRSFQEFTRSVLINLDVFHW